MTAAIVFDDSSGFILCIPLKKKYGKRRVIETMAYRIGKCLLPDRLRQIGMTQQQLAEKMGVSKQQVNRWCNNRQGMTMETAKNIAAIVGLHCSDELYEWKSVPSRN